MEDNFIEGRPFTDVIGDLENGYLLKELTTKVYEIVRAVRETRKPGALSLKVKISPTGRGSVEEVRADIVDPDAARLLDIVRTFKASKRVEFDSVVYQPNGDVKLGYEERTEQKGSSGNLPEQMKLGIPVYFRGAAYAVPVFVRYKVDNGAVVFVLKIDRAEIIEEAAFTELTAAVKEQAAIDVYLGRR